MIPACPSLMCFFNRADTEETNFSKVLCLMFVYVLFCVGLCQTAFCVCVCVDNLWFDDSCAE